MPADPENKSSSSEKQNTDNEKKYSHGSENNEDKSADTGNTETVSNARTEVPLGEAFKSSGTYEDELSAYNYEYEFTVLDSNPMEASAPEDYGFPTYNGAELRILDVRISANITVIDDKNKSSYLYDFMPRLWGSDTPHAGGIFAVKYWGFDGCLDDNLHDVTGFKTLKSGESGSYTAEGKVIISVIPGESMYFVISSPDDNFIYFCIK